MDKKAKAASKPAKRKRYERPKLSAWGSIHELTRGPGSGAQDFPFLGGTEPI